MGLNGCSLKIQGNFQHPSAIHRTWHCTVVLAQPCLQILKGKRKDSSATFNRQKSSTTKGPTFPPRPVNCARQRLSSVVNFVCAAFWLNAAAQFRLRDSESGANFTQPKNSLKYHVGTNLTRGKEASLGLRRYTSATHRSLDLTWLG